MFRIHIELIFYVTPALIGIFFGVMLDMQSFQLTGFLKRPGNTIVL